MTATLTLAERRAGLMLALLLALTGLAMAAAGRQGPFMWHGFMALGLGLWLTLRLGASLIEAPEPPAIRQDEYYDAPARFGIAMTLVWAIVGMGVGVWVAALMHWPEATPPWPWTGYGRLRPLHTTGVIFGFGGNALIATSLHVLQRTSRARLADQLSPWVVLIGYNLFLVWATTGYLMGVTQSKEYAESEWYADILLVLVWVTYLALYLRTLARRTELHI